jgi:hypothetical protein
MRSLVPEEDQCKAVKATRIRAVHSCALKAYRKPVTLGEDALYRPGRRREGRWVDALMQRDSAHQQLTLSVDEFYHGAFLDYTG